MDGNRGTCDEAKHRYKDTVFLSHSGPEASATETGDGMGDLYGVLQKLDYIKSLGCDGIWFSPLYPSPGADCGYDISDYMDIDPQFGGMEAFKAVLEGAHSRGMKVIMDLVVNHTSDEHECSRRAAAALEPYTDYYIFGVPPGKTANSPITGIPTLRARLGPMTRCARNNMRTCREAPDLNMDNPLVREEVKKIMRFGWTWGDGFRRGCHHLYLQEKGLAQ